ncbi:MAG: hypothetical protein QXN55_01290 [Candidatus Nitrosotenuis sp.]
MTNLKKSKGVEEGKSYKRFFDIINTHLDGERSILDCKADLIEAELGAYAKL